MNGTQAAAEMAAITIMECGSWAASMWAATITPSFAPARKAMAPMTHVLRDAAGNAIGHTEVLDAV